MPQSLSFLAQQLDEKRVSSQELTEKVLANAEDPQGQGKRVFIRQYAQTARAAAQMSDVVRQSGQRRSLIDGLSISIKDLFDVAGEPTTAGSVVGKNFPPAPKNAEVLDRLTAAGAVVVGCTNMTEFAYSGLGLNPHYGTPLNPWERDKKRIPGGSSSGAAISITDGMAHAAVGSDTGGSVRIPSALCGLTGFKPSAQRISMQGVLPLSAQLDSIGTIAPSVTCCAIVDSIISGEYYKIPMPRPLSHLRLMVPQTLVLDQMDAHVSDTFERVLRTLSEAGAHIDLVDMLAFNELPTINAAGGFTAAESWAWHRQTIAKDAHLYDPRVLSRIQRGAAISAADYIDLLAQRADWQARVHQTMQHYDALLMPTVPIVAPLLETLENSEEQYFALNGLILRNSTVINFLDGCAISLPCHSQGTGPVGLTVAGMNGQDQQMVSISLAIERCLAQNVRGK